MRQIITAVLMAIAWTLLVGCSQTMPSQKAMQLHQMADQRSQDLSLFRAVLKSGTIEEKQIAALGLGRIGGAAPAEILLNVLNDTSVEVRRKVVLGLGLTGESSATSALVEQFKIELDPAVRNEILLSLGNLGGPVAYQHLIATLLDSESINVQQGYAAQAIGLLLTWHSDDVYLNEFQQVPTLLQLATGESFAATQAAFALTRLPEERLSQHAHALTKSIAKAKNIDAATFLMRAWGRQTNKEDYLAIFPLLQSSHRGVNIETIRALQSLVDKPLVRQILITKLDHQDTHVAATALAGLLGQMDERSLQPLISRVLNDKRWWLKGLVVDYLLQNQPLKLKPLLANELELAPRWFRVKLFTAVKQAYPEQHRSLFNDFVKKYDWITENDSDLERVLNPKADSGIDGNPVRFNESAADVFVNANQLIEITTNRGAFQIQLFSEAMYTAHNFTRLVNQSFYNGSIFSRVIPNFVVQGGEHHGDGSGTVGYSIREEITQRSHLPRTVGMATMGKDTGGAQFFINLAPNLHLDRRYTIFGEVISGWEVAKRLNLGDWIITAEVVE